jgi:coatomer subunit gamma
LYDFCQVIVVVDASEADEFSEVASKPLRSLPFDSPGQTYVAFEKPEGVLSVGKFSNVLRFFVKEVDVPVPVVWGNESPYFFF